MKKIVILTYLILVELYCVNGQDWCKRKPANFDKSPFSINHKLSNDRFYHTISPDIIKLRNYQIETALFLRHEYYDNNNFNGKDTLSTFNVYSGIKIKHAILSNLEIHLSLVDFIVKSDEEISEYGGDNLRSRVAFGTKYFLYGNNNAKLSLYNQFTIPLHDTLNILLSAELRILYSRMLTKKLYLTSNIGGVYINRANYSFLYALELKWIASKRLEFFAEFYKNYLETRQLSIPNKRWLLGVGYYLRENFYCYSSYENGLDNEDLLNGGRFDIGFTYQF